MKYVLDSENLPEWMEDCIETSDRIEESNSEGTYEFTETGYVGNAASVIAYQNGYVANE